METLGFCWYLFHSIIRNKEVVVVDSRVDKAEVEAAEEVSEEAVVEVEAEAALVTKNLFPGEAVYNERKIFVQNEDEIKVDTKIWNPFRSKLAEIL